MGSFHIVSKLKVVHCEEENSERTKGRTFNARRNFMSLETSEACNH